MKEVNSLKQGTRTWNETIGGDTKHQIVYEIKLFGNGILHRFNNAGGCPYSAIYVDNFEVWSCERKGETRMIHEWNAMFLRRQPRTHNYTI